MALNSIGPISLGGDTTGQSVAIELSLSAFAQISINDSTLRNLVNIASGQISLSNFYGASNYIPKAMFYETGVTPDGLETFTFTTETGTSQSLSGIGDRSRLYNGNGNKTRSLWIGSFTASANFTDSYTADWATSTWQSTSTTQPNSINRGCSGRTNSKAYWFAGLGGDSVTQQNVIDSQDFVTYTVSRIGATLNSNTYYNSPDAVNTSNYCYLFPGVGRIAGSTTNLLQRFTFSTESMNTTYMTLSPNLPTGQSDNTNPFWSPVTMNGPTNSYWFGNATSEYGIPSDAAFWFNFGRTIYRFTYSTEGLANLGQMAYYFQQFRSSGVSSPTVGYMKGYRGTGPSGTGAYSTSIALNTIGGSKITYSSETFAIFDSYAVLASTNKASAYCYF